MPIDFDADLDAMLGGLDSVTLAFGAYSGPAVQDTWDEDTAPGVERGVMAGRLALQFRTSAFPGLAIGSAVTVDGVSYVVADRRRPIDAADGRLTQVLLRKP